KRDASSDAVWDQSGPGRPRVGSRYPGHGGGLGRHEGRDAAWRDEGRSEGGAHGGPPGAHRRLSGLGDSVQLPAGPIASRYRGRGVAAAQVGVTGENSNRRQGIPSVPEGYPAPDATERGLRVQESGARGLGAVDRGGGAQGGADR